MQYNLVASSNVGAVRLWKKLGFSIVGTLPEAFRHPRLGFVDAYVMYKSLPLAEPYVERGRRRANPGSRPPRGIPKTQFSTQDWYDVWFPNLAPSLDTMKLGQAAASPAQWSQFTRKDKAEMAGPEAKHDLELLTALSHTTNFSVGCYCPHEDRCHRSILKRLLVQNGAKVL